ncbi:MAG: cytochrome b N-terminal domain-containing protein [Bacteroidales bacterium]
MLNKVIEWIDDKTGLVKSINPLISHPVPPDAKWYYVFGSATFFCFILQVVTGIALAFLYQPSTTTAYESLKFITDGPRWAHFLRGIHYFGASGMILLVGVHMIRVYLTASFKYPRELSWITGSILLLITVTMGFTGQLLRWDSNGVWSAIVGAEQAGRVPFFGKSIARMFLGGDTLTGLTVMRFFSIHVFLLPALLFGLIGLHLSMVIRNGISEPPKAGRKVDPKTYRKWYRDQLDLKGVPFWPNAGWRDLTFGLLAIGVIILLAVVKGPPAIGKPPDIADIYANPRPDWYFMWVFALFALMPRGIETFAIAFSPIFLVLVLILLPLINNRGERSPLRRPWSIAIVTLVVIIIGSFWVIGVKSPWSPAFNTKPLPQEVIGNVSAEARVGGDLFFTKACIYCHTISGNGGKRGPDLTHVADRITADQITIRIVNGARNMPAFGGTLTAADLKDLVKFLETRHR